MIHSVIQGSSDWFDLRCGRVTGSRVGDAIATLKRKKDDNGQPAEAAVRYNMRKRIAREIMTGVHTDSYVSKAMEIGREREPLARTEYELKTKADVRLIGFVDHPSIERAGFSPDGYVGTDGIIEIKCPLPETHIDYLIARSVPEDYEPQVMWGLACTGRAWCDFVSYDPDQVKRHQLLIVRKFRDEERIKQMNAAVIRFLEEVDSLVARLEAGDNYYIEQLEASIAARK